MRWFFFFFGHHHQVLFPFRFLVAYTPHQTRNITKFLFPFFPASPGGLLFFVANTPQKTSNITRWSFPSYYGHRHQVFFSLFFFGACTPQQTRNVTGWFSLFLFSIRVVFPFTPNNRHEISRGGLFPFFFGPTSWSFFFGARTHHNRLQISRGGLLLFFGTPSPGILSPCHFLRMHTTTDTQHHEVVCGLFFLAPSRGGLIFSRQYVRAKRKAFICCGTVL